MSGVPSRGDMGELICPRCQSPLTRRTAPFFIRNQYVGKFDSIVCGICPYSALTSTGYKAAMLEAEKLGLVGAREELFAIPTRMYDILQETEEQFAIGKIVEQESFSNKGIIVKSDEEIKDGALTTSGEIISTPYLKKYARRTYSMYDVLLVAKN